MLLDAYYKIWVDAITKFRSRPENKGLWKFYCIVFIGMSMAFNLATIMAILERAVFKRSFYHIRIFKSEYFNNVSSFFILFFLAPLILNYLLIFRNNRYEILITKYKTYNGKLFAWYFVLSLFLPFVLLVTGYLLLQLFG